MQTVIEDERDKFIVQMHGEVVDILCSVSPKSYLPFVMTDKWGNKQILVIMNPYDLCVWNKKVHDKQLTICFHVDDCKLLHMSPKVLDDPFSGWELIMRTYLKMAVVQWK